MTVETNKPQAWKNFDGSILPTLLMHDTWPVEFGVPLICNIHPDSVGLCGEFEKKAKPDPWTVIGLLSLPRDLTFDLTALEADDDYDFEAEEEDANDIRECFSFHRMSGSIDNDVQLIDLFHQARKSEQAYRRVKSIFDSHPDHAFGCRMSPQYFVEWALSKGIEIPWLGWARARGYLVEDSTESQLKTNEKLQSDKPSDKRKQKGLHAALAILNHKHADGELNDWQDFKRCMRKAEFIALIRDNPTDYPNCNKTIPQLNNDQAQTTKDREPTLSRSFSDFTRDPTILAAYERLINQN